MSQREKQWQQYRQQAVASGSTPTEVDARIANFRAMHLPPPGSPGIIPFAEILPTSKVSAGSRRVSGRGAVSHYAVRLEREASPLEARLRRSGKYEETVRRLRQLLGRVRRGEMLVHSFADGTTAGWDVRNALATRTGYGENVVDWDKGHTKRERIALVESVLEDLGAPAATNRRKGGWAVSGARSAP